MARIQILELPMEHGPDDQVVTPFVLILDQCSAAEMQGHLGNALANLRDACGARAALIAAETIDLVGPTPEEIAACSQRPDVGTATVKIVPDMSGFVDAIREAVEAIEPQKLTVHIGDHDITDIVRTEIAEHTQARLDALSNGRG
jgi:hypothetical protein